MQLNCLLRQKQRSRNKYVTKFLKLFLRASRPSQKNGSNEKPLTWILHWNTHYLIALYELHKFLGHFACVPISDRWMIIIIYKYFRWNSYCCYVDQSLALFAFVWCFCQVALKWNVQDNKMKLATCVVARKTIRNCENKVRNCARRMSLSTIA